MKITKLLFTLLVSTAALFFSNAFADPLIPRYGHSAVVLGNGDFILIGGYDTTSTSFADTVQRYNKTTNTFENVGSSGAQVQRMNHTSTMLPSGKILVFGGKTDLAGTVYAADAFVLDPETGNRTTLSLAANQQRYGHTANLMPDGKVLIMGGMSPVASLPSETVLIFNPADNSIAVRASMTSARAFHTSSLLQNGQVFVAGGIGLDAEVPTNTTYKETTEIYDYATNRWTPSTAMAQQRAHHSAAVMPDGYVLLIGGYHDLRPGIDDDYELSYGYVREVEIFDPASTSISKKTPFPYYAKDTAVNLLPTGTLFVTGGQGVPGKDDTKTGSFTVNTGSYIDITAGTNPSFSVGEATASTIVMRSRINLENSNTSFKVESGKVHIINTTDPGYPYIDINKPVARFRYPGTADASLTGSMWHKGELDGLLKMETLPTIVMNDNEPFEVKLTGTGTCNVTANTLSDITAGSCNLNLSAFVPEGFAQTGINIVKSRITLESLSVVYADGTLTIEFPAGYELHSNTTGIPVTLGTFALGTFNFDLSTYSASTTVPNPTQVGSLTIRSFQATGGLEAVPSRIYITAETPLTQSEIEVDVSSALFANYNTYDYEGNAWDIKADFANSAKFEEEPMYTIAQGFSQHTDFISNAGDPYTIAGYTGNPNTAWATRAGYNDNALAFTPTSTNSFIRKLIIDSLWSVTSAMNQARGSHTATLLADGSVLVAGGSATPNGDTLLSAELYNPQSDIWNVAASMNVARAFHTAEVMPDNSVLVAGGYEKNSSTAVTTSTSEIYHPSSDSWQIISNMNFERQQHRSAYIGNGPDGGAILVMGGYSKNEYLNSCEVYSSTTGVWAVRPSMNIRRAQFTSTILHDGKIMVIGGIGGTTGSNSQTLNSAEIYDPVAQTWTPVPNMSQPRHGHTATLLEDGRVLVTGGNNGNTILGNTEIYNPVTNTWSPLYQWWYWKDLDDAANPETIRYQRYKHTSTLLPNGSVLVLGGQQTRATDILKQTEKYAIIGNSWTTNVVGWYETYNLNTARSEHTATLLYDGRVLVAGGFDGLNYTTSSEARYFMAPPNEKLQPREVKTDMDNFDRTATITLRSGASNFFGLSETSNSANNQTSQATPRVSVLMANNPSGFVKNLTDDMVRDMLESASANPNTSWTTMKSSMTFSTGDLPYGWYQFLASVGGAFSQGYRVFVAKPKPLAGISDIHATDIQTSSITWQWTNGLTQTDTDGYRLYVSSNMFVISTTTKETSTFVQDGLAANTQMAISIAPFNITSVGDLTHSATFYTLAMPPVNLAVKTASFSSVTLEWDPNGNTDYTRYEVQMSTSPLAGSSPEAAPWTTPIPFSAVLVSTGAIIDNLSAGREYFFRVRAQNGREGDTSYTTPIPTPYTVPVSTVAIGNVGDIKGTPQSTSRIIWTWPAVEGDNISYRIYNGQSVFLTTTTAPTYELVSLTTNTAYSIAVQTVAGESVAVGSVMGSPSVYTLAAPPIKDINDPVPAPNAITVYWQMNHNPATTEYVAEISAKENFSELISTTTVTQVSTATVMSAKFTSLTPNTKYYIRVKSANHDGVYSSYYNVLNGAGKNYIYTYVAGPAFTDRTSTASAAKVTWDRGGNPENTVFQLRYGVSGSTNTVTAIPFSSGFTGVTHSVSGLLTGTEYTFYLKARNDEGEESTEATTSIVTGLGTSGAGAGAISGLASEGTIKGTLLNGRTVTITVPNGAFENPDKVEVALGQGSGDPCDSGKAVFNLSITNNLQPKIPISVEVSYIVNGQNELEGEDVSRAALARVNPVNNRCLTQDTIVDQPNTLLKSQIPHITANTNPTVLQIVFAREFQGLGNVFIYPNPVRPNRGHAAAIIQNVPKNSKIVVYTLSGTRVWEHSNENSSVVSWPARNKAGKPVASGVYIISIDAPSEQKTFKVAVER